MHKSFFLLFLHICFYSLFLRLFFRWPFQRCCSETMVFAQGSIVTPSVSVIDGWLWVRHKLSRLHSPHLRANANVRAWGLVYSDCPVLEINPTAVPRGWDLVAVSLERMETGGKKQSTRACTNTWGWGCVSLVLFFSVKRAASGGVCGGSIAGSWVLGYRQPTLWSSHRASSLGPACCARHFGCISLLPRRMLRRDNSLIPLSQRRKPLLSKQIFWQAIWQAVEIMPLCFEVEGAMQRSPETGSSLEPHEDLPLISF